MEVQAHSFFRTTTGIQSRPDVLENHGWLWIFLTNLGARGILCMFTLVLEDKAGKEILEFLKKFSANNFTNQMPKTKPPSRWIEEV